MKRAVSIFLVLLSCTSLRAENGAGKQIENARFQIIKETVEFLASDKGNFKEVTELQCKDCNGYDELINFVRKNKIKRADELINDWQKAKIDTNALGFKKSLTKFKEQIITKITSGTKSNRKTLITYESYENRLALIIEAVAIAEPDAGNASNIEKVQESPDSVDEPVVTEPVKIMEENTSESASYFSFLPDLSKDMSYTIILLLLAGILFLIWVLRNKNKIIDKNERALKEQLNKSGSTEWQSKNMSNELKAVSQKLKAAEAEMAVLQENLKAETERNERLSAVAETRKPVVKKPEPKPVMGSVVKYARYADQGDGFSVQELLDEEDSETIFEITPLSPNTASFRISGNQNAQRYALSNSPYFLGKTSQYDTFPSGNSLIITDVPGELKLQGNKWLIVKPVHISFS